MNIKKVLFIGQVPSYLRYEKLFIKTEIKDGKLSISGVIGPRKSGNSAGGCGQIDMEFVHRDPKQNDKRYHNTLIPYQKIKYAKNWNATKWLDLLDIWHKWHLNDMKASCEHQRDLGWDEQAAEEVIIYKWKLKSDYLERQRELEYKAIDDLKEKGIAKMDEYSREIFAKPYTIETREKELPYTLDTYYQADESHEKKTTRGSLRVDEHADGILSKSCPSCGYKYGHSWIKRPLPAEVISFIESLPESEITPAWV